jgi:hypothetical protein
VLHRLTGLQLAERPGGGTRPCRATVGCTVLVVGWDEQAGQTCILANALGRPLRFPDLFTSRVLASLPIPTNQTMNSINPIGDLTPSEDACHQATVCLEAASMALIAIYRELQRAPTPTSDPIAPTLRALDDWSNVLIELVGEAFSEFRRLSGRDHPLQPY